MKKIMVMVMIVLFMVAPAFADYTIELKNEGGSVLKIYTIPNTQVAHLQKAATNTGTSVLDQLEKAIMQLIRRATEYNLSAWRRDNEAYIEEQSRQP